MVSSQATVLIVDDEENILSSLKRLLRPDGYSVVAASSADQGFEILQSQPVWLVISDNAMPGTNGIEFLKGVRERWPDTIRIMMTGYASLDASMEAINRGEVYRFITKPWDPADLREVIRQGVEQYKLLQDNREMQALIRRQNEELQEWNGSLQKKVEERTAEIQQKSQEVERLYLRMKNSFVVMIKVFTDLIELRWPAGAGHGRRVAVLTEAIARQMGLAEEDVKNVQIAGLLHDLGKIGLPDSILQKDDRLLTLTERATLRQHPALGQAGLQVVENLEPVGLIVRHHHEKWDGTGYPDELRWEGIPIESRILAVANLLDHYQQLKRGSTESFIELYQREAQSGYFDPAVLLALKQVVSSLTNASVPEKSDSRVALRRNLFNVRPTGQPSGQEIRISPRALEEGMVLSRDLRMVTGMTLLAEGEVLKSAQIDKLISYIKQQLITAEIWICN